MFEVVITSVILLSIGGYIAHIKKQGDKKFKIVETEWSNNILTFIERNGLKDIDIEFRNEVDLKKKSTYKEYIKFVGLDIKKGYDFIDSTFESGYYFGPHDHHHASEFIYVIDGEMKISLCKNTPDFCDNCNGNCPLYNNEEIDSTEIKILKSGDFVYIESGKFHTFEALKDSRCITIAMPPISTRD